MKYTGSCHCQSVKFEFESEEIKSALKCNCSICIRKNAVMSQPYFSKPAFKIISGENELSTYQWGDKDVNHYFCKHCGVHPFHDTTYEPGKYRVNLNCVEQVNHGALDIHYFDGRNEL